MMRRTRERDWNAIFSLERIFQHKVVRSCKVFLNIIAAVDVQFDGSMILLGGAPEMLEKA